MKKILVLLFVAHITIVKAQNNCPLLINEILFDPPKEGCDYVELYNNSGQTLSLSDYLIANRNATGGITSIKRLTRQSNAIRAGAFVVITEDSAWLRDKFETSASIQVLQLSSLPSWPNDAGSVVLLRASDSAVCDQLDYDATWHFGLINDPESVALERISYEMPTNSRENWASASSSSGFGTPGIQNSHRLWDYDDNRGLSFVPRVFTPDNDGIDDFAQLIINVEQTGFIANAVIYDASGRPVKYFLRNAVLGSRNLFRWEGDDDARSKLPSGVYVLLTTLFNLEGFVQKFKNVIVIGKRVH